MRSGQPTGRGGGAHEPTCYGARVPGGKASATATPIPTVLRRAAVVGGLGSLLVHLSFVVSLVWIAIPSVDFELTFPLDVELGLTEATEVAMGTPAPAVDPPPASPGGGEGEGAGPDAGVPIDAGRRARRDAGAPDAGVLDAAPADGGDGGIGGETEVPGPPVAFLPAGAQIALRIDLDLVRASELRPDVEALLTTLPDWEALLAGSGVDPVRDFSRVLVATPNFDRRRIVVAGQMTDDAPDAHEVVERMAREHGDGASIEWRRERGVEVATWYAADGFPREVAILRNRYFVVARPEDVPRVLAIAARRRRGAEDPADALLSLGEGEALSLEVDGIRRLVPEGTPVLCPVATRGRVALRPSETGIDVALTVHFDDADEAERADRCYLRLVGFGSATFPPLAPILDRVATTREGAAVTATSAATLEELRTIFATFAPPAP